MGFCLLEAQENPHLYPEYQRAGGSLNTKEMIQGEFGIDRRYAYRLMDFAEIREKSEAIGHTFPANEAQARVLAPYKDDDEMLEAIIERAKEVTDGTLKLSASQLIDFAPLTPKTVLPGGHFPATEY